MLIDTQIKSFLIPRDLWKEGRKDMPLLPPIDLAAQDALDIEQRAGKGTNLLSESRRYVLCCERIQSIVQDLARVPGVLPPPLLWPSRTDAEANRPTARAYLALCGLMPGWMGRYLVPERPKCYMRVRAVFFPPEDASHHVEVYQFINDHPDSKRLFDRAAREGSVGEGPFALTPAECRSALLMRLELLKVSAVQEGYGLVDVIELV
jgi:hypothetical protein